MSSGRTWRVRVPAGVFMTYFPIVLMVLASLSVSAWVIIGSGSGRTPTEMMGKQGALSEYAPVLKYGAVLLLSGIFWLFWRHRHATLRIEEGYLILKRQFGQRSLPLERIRPACSRLFARRGEDRPVGVVCHLTGDPSDKGFRVFGYEAQCPPGLIDSVDLYGKSYDMIFMEPAEFRDFLDTLQRT